MTPRRRRMIGVAAIVIGCSLATALALRAFQSNLVYFYTPAEMRDANVQVGRKVRLGGLVMPGSVERAPGSLRVSFDVTDNQETIKVVYEGVLPDLFRDGQGVIADGRMEPDGLFRAEEVLAKHDENYMPPEVAAKLEEAGHPGQP